MRVEVTCGKDWVESWVNVGRIKGYCRMPYWLLAEGNRFYSHTHYTRLGQVLKHQPPLGGMR